MLLDCFRKRNFHQRKIAQRSRNSEGKKRKRINHPIFPWHFRWSKYIIFPHSFSLVLVPVAYCGSGSQKSKEEKETREHPRRGGRRPTPVMEKEEAPVVCPGAASLPSLPLPLPQQAPAATCMPQLSACKKPPQK